MTNNDILRRVRFIFNFNDDTMMKLFELGGLQVTRAEVSDWLKHDDDPAFIPLTDTQLSIFLNGLIVKKRGKKEGPQPEPESRLNNNIILRKLKIALDYQEDDLLATLASAGFPLGRHELSALFRKPGHKNYRKCKSQLLRNFLNGLQHTFRKDIGAAASANPPKDDDVSDSD